MLENLFIERLKKKPFLIMAHRGLWGGNIIENSIESTWLAFKAGADIVEIDVCRTLDEQYYLFHDKSETRLLGKRDDFHTLLSTDVDKSDVFNSIGTKSGYKINRLSQFLDWLPKDKLINVDRSWRYWGDETFFTRLGESGKQRQLVLKSPVKREYLDNLSKNGPDFSYIPIIQNKEEWDLVQSYTNIKTVGAELIVPDLESSFLTDRTWLTSSSDTPLFTVANSENLGSDFNLFGGQNDDVSLFHEEKWNPFVHAGIDVIQTDWPHFLSEYRQKLK